MLVCWALLVVASFDLLVVCVNCLVSRCFWMILVLGVMFVLIVL